MLIGKLYNEEMGIRAIERVTGHHRDTVSRIVKDLADHAEFVEGLHATLLDPEAEHEVDELWTLSKKGGERNACRGWRRPVVYTCMRRRSYFLVGFSIGGWTQKTCRDITRVKDGLEGGKAAFYSDGNDDYLYVPRVLQRT
ncbi:MAG TPA: hypothetical protein VK436_07605 [Methanocella sp.]|nr:hypothetical protein [Methanocella sp.]